MLISILTNVFILAFNIKSTEATSVRKIVFESDGSIYVINSDGTGKINLTKGAYPRWSPDGERISYSYGGKFSVIKIDGTSKIDLGSSAPKWFQDGSKILYAQGNMVYVINADGTSKIALDEGYYFDWSPNGKKIVYINIYDNLCVINSDGTDKVRLAPKVNRQLPQWGADGKRIAYNKENTGMGYPWYETHIIKVDGTDDIASGGYAGKWSPDGKAIAYICPPEYVGYPYQLKLMYFDEEGNKERIVTIVRTKETGNILDTTFTWSPDNKKILYCIWGSSWFENVLGYHIVDIEKGTDTFVGKTSDTTYPIWSPDGQKIAYKFKNYIYVANADGTMKINLGEGENPQWSSDSGKVVFEYTEKFGDEVLGYYIYIVNANGTGKIQLKGRYPRLSPDGEQIAFSSEDGKVMYVVNTNGSGLTEVAHGFNPQWSPVLSSTPTIVANAGPDKAVFSGELVQFDGSSSYASEGTIISYQWDFGGGATAQGKIVSHRFRGSQNEPKTYTVTLTVENNYGVVNTDIVYVTVAPLEKTVEVSGSPASAKMKVMYNWIEQSNGEDVYIVSKIDVEGSGFVGIFVPTIWIWGPLYPFDVEVPSPEFLDYLFAKGVKTEKTYPPFTTKPVIGISPSVTTRTFVEGDFEGVQVKGSDVMSIYMQGFTLKLGWPPIDVELFEFSSVPFDPHVSAIEPSLLQKLLDKLLEKLPDLIIGKLGSPGEFRVYDSQGKITGLVSGQVKEKIPNSAYFNNTIILLSSNSSYIYEVKGTEEGSYGLILASLAQNKSTTFTATDIPISANAIHQFSLNWSAISQSQQGATIKVDLDGDGTFEKTFTSDNELTRDEFISQVHPLEGFPVWIVGVAIAAIAAVTASAVIFWRRRKHPPTK